MAEQQVAERLGGRAIAPGQPIPVMTEEWMNASDLVEVLEHQMNDERERLLRMKWESAQTGLMH